MDSLEEKIVDLKGQLAKLVQQGWDIDLSFVDWEESASQILLHEELDASEGDSLAEMDLADMRGILRAVYLNGEKVFNFQNDAITELFRIVVKNMAKYADAALAYEDEGETHPQSDKQMNREGMITAVEQLKPGRWLMIYRNNEPSGLVRVKAVMSNDRLFTALEWGKNPGVKEPGWIGDCLLKIEDLGIIPHASGLWETMSWAEAVNFSEITRE